jgi:hypothetical protein
MPDPTDPNAPSARKQLEDMARGFYRGKVLVAAVQLGIADALGDGERSLDELASTTSSHRDLLHRLLRTLASMGLLAETAAERYRLLPLGQPLRRDAPESVKATVEFWADLLADQWNYLAACIRAGSRAQLRAELASKGAKPRIEADPARTGALFHGCFAESPAESHEGFARAIDFSTSRVVADLGGGGGGLLVAVLTAHPHLQGLLIDLEGAMRGARERIEAAGLADRCALRVCDLTKSVPPEADTYLIKHVLHIDDERARRILVRCHEAMAASDRLFVLEHVLPERVERADPVLEDALMLDLNMLTVTGGCERTEPAWRALLASTGFALRRVVRVGGTEVRVIEATRTA